MTSPKPPWIRVRMPFGESYTHLKELMRSISLHTVCEEARCPNIAECWGRGTATFLILGDVCTRNCHFCAVKTGWPGSANLEDSEPMRVVDAVTKMKLRHVVITSVTRDDLPDGGAAIFAETIRQIHSHVDGCSVEVLIPDFRGNHEALGSVVQARPEILGHNIETVPRLYPRVRPQAIFSRSIGILKSAKEFSRNQLTKSGIMVGLGESWDEILKSMDYLRDAECDILSIGQYLSPSRAHLPVLRYYTPEEFEELKEAARRAGFRYVESGPFVRSSYHADAQAAQLAPTLPAI